MTDNPEKPVASTASDAPVVPPAESFGTPASGNPESAAATPAAAAPADGGANGGAAAADTKGAAPAGERRDGDRPRRPRQKRKRTPKSDRGPRPERGGRPERGAKGPGRRQPGELLVEALRDLASAYVGLRQRTGFHSGPVDQGEVELSFRLPLKQRDIPATAETLMASLRTRLEQDMLAKGFLVPGRAWNFQSESFEDDICRPSDPRQVLVSYGQEGRPRFADLVTLAIERKHEAVEQLLAGKEGAVAFIESGKDVTQGVIPTFDPATAPYVLVGQAMIGLFESSEEGKRVALTIQVLAHKKGEDGKVRFHLHIVCASDLVDLPDPSIHRILKAFQRQLNELGNRFAGKQAQATPALAAGAEASAPADATAPAAADAASAASASSDTPTETDTTDAGSSDSSASTSAEGTPAATDPVAAEASAATDATPSAPTPAAPTTPADPEEMVLAALRDLVRKLSHDARNRDRKTDHARERSEESQRPTQFAFDEAKSARDHHLYIDTEEKTVVVIGKKGRVHVFSMDGRHVTSVIIPPPQVRSRVSQGRWRQAEPAERGTFRDVLARSTDKPS